MKLRKLSKIIGFCLLLFVIFYFINKKEKVELNEIDKNKIEDFDIILSKGQSVQSKLIGLLKFSIEDYSHIGIMIKENDKVFVLHSTPDGTITNGIRYDDLQTFFNLSDVSEYTVLRHQNITSDFRQKLTEEFERFKNSQAPFDFDFNNYDHSKIYCSELVYIILKNSGLLTLQEFEMTKPIYPKYFLKLERLITVNTMKTSP